jgi:flagellar hook-length control protein FliK
VDIVVSPNLVSLNPQSSSHAGALAPGDVVDAVVLALLENGKARLAVANTIIDVLTKVPLEAGATVRLAVKHTNEGMQLVIVDPGSGSGKSGVAVPASAGGGAQPNVGTPTSPAGTGIATAGASGKISANAAALPLPDGQEPASARLPSPTVALTTAVRVAAARQDGLAPLFANLGEAVQLPALPAAVREAAAQLLAMRVPVQAEEPADPAAVSRNPSGARGVPVSPGEADAAPAPAAKLSADDVKAALRRSGLFLETNLAAAAAADAPATAPPPNDLKAALAVFRQILKTWLDDDGAPLLRDGAPPTLRDAQSLVPGMRLPAEPAKDPLAKLGAQQSTQTQAPDVPAHVAPPPPYRGAPTTPQPPSAPSIVPDDTPHEIGAKLLAETDAALARQTLLQAASLERSDAQAPRNDASGPRWHFEIPFATPQGTSIAQFEVSRDGRHAPPKGQSATWRARFSFDIEPAGPVHAQVALTGARAAVTLWAERPGTAAQLRENAALLSSALRDAELDPGDVMVRDGMPPRPQVQAPAGRFVDRAS